MKTTVLLLVVAAVLLAPAAQAKTAGLKGEVGPGFAIEVKLGNKDVKNLKPGSYTMLVEDKAAIHNFHLSGPGVNKSTGVSFQGKQTWRLTLRKGTYRYRCDPHATSMSGSFTVG
jgi:plastocyanin